MEQREFLFKAFHKKRKETYNVYGFNSEFVFKDTLDGIGTDGNPDKREDVVLLQYTGLKDVNKQMIFERDFVRCFGSICKVIFSDGAFFVQYDCMKFHLTKAMILSQLLTIIR